MSSADLSLKADKQQLGVILVDHGSRRDESNELLLDVVQQFAEADRVWDCEVGQVKGKAVWRHCC